MPSELIMALGLSFVSMAAAFALGLLAGRIGEQIKLKRALSDLQQSYERTQELLNRLERWLHDHKTNP